MSEEVAGKTISVVCKYCLKPFEVPVDLAGKVCECVYCGASLEIPEEPGLANPPQAVADSDAGRSVLEAFYAERSKKAPPFKSLMILGFVLCLAAGLWPVLNWSLTQTAQGIAERYPLSALFSDIHRKPADPGAKDQSLQEYNDALDRSWEAQRDEQHRRWKAYQEARARVRTILWIQFSAALAVAVLYFVWIYRAYRNLGQLHTVRRFSPAGVVGWHFVPIVDIIIPYMAWMDLWKGSDPEGLASGRTRSPALVTFWWILGPASGIMNAVSFFFTGFMPVLIMLGIEIVWTVLTITLVQIVSRWQRERYKRIEGALDR